MIKWVQRLLAPLIFIFCMLLGWEVIVRVYQIEDWILPAPSSILHAFVQQQDYMADLVATARIALLGLLIGMVVGYFFAAISQLMPWLRKAIYPLLLLSQNIPMIALAPLLIVWFGFGDLPKLIVVALVCFFPITVSSLNGFAQTEQALWTYFKISGWSRWQLFWKLEVPSALPQFFSGLKLSATYSVMGAVIAEWLGAEEGIGQVIKVSSSSFAVVQVFVAMTWVVLLSLSFFMMISLLEKWLIRWRPASRGEQK